MDSPKVEEMKQELRRWINQLLADVEVYAPLNGDADRQHFYKIEKRIIDVMSCHDSLRVRCEQEPVFEAAIALLTNDRAAP